VRPILIAVVAFISFKLLLGGWLWPAVAGITTAVLVVAMLVRSNTAGLAKSNVAAYAEGRRRGLSHRDALHRTVLTRYAILPERARATHVDKVWTTFTQSGPHATEAEDLRDLVIVIFMHEHPGVMDAKATTMLMNGFDEAITKHGLWGREELPEG